MADHRRDAAAGALNGVRVLDLTRLFPGQYCTMLLGDLGAEVLKVEEPARGDYLRWWPPFQGSESVLFLALNRNKRSMRLNLKAERGQEILRELARRFDVLVEGNKPGVMDRLGLGYETLSQVNPRLIYCSITGYGQDGPYRDHAGHDINYCGIGGILGITGTRDGELAIPGVQIADMAAGGMGAAISILAALLARERTGRGQSADVSMLDGLVSMVGHLIGLALATGNPLLPGRFLLNGGVPCYGIYETRDGKHVTLGALEEKFWLNLCKTLGRPDLVECQFATGEQGELARSELAAIFRTRTRRQWIELLQGEHMCLGGVHSLNEVATDPQVTARQMVWEGDHPTAGAHNVIAAPVKLSDTPATMRSPAPQFGEHTREVLAELGYSSEDIQRLRADGIVSTE